MSIGSTVKRLRREKDITQEQLAEYLGVTSRAVSQWECDRTAPDISQIPALCHIFDVSSDVLLGIDIEKTKEEIQKHLNEAKNALYNGQFEKNAEILREANRKFPKSYEIMAELASALVSVYSRKGIKEYDEVFALCNRILAECTDSKTRCGAMRTLGTAYNYAGKKEEMLQLAEEMPRSHLSYENFMLYSWEGDKGLEERRLYMAYLINQMLSSVHLLAGHRGDNGKYVYSLEERKKLWQLEIELLELFHPDGDYQYNAQEGNIACSRLVASYLNEKDYEKVWHWLEKGADFAINNDTYGFGTPHTSLVLKGYVHGGWIMEEYGNCSQVMLDWLTTDKDMEILRSDERYKALVNRLKAVAKKPE
ncbi:MAG: helix-turn-helix transcriptional regulator [Clostridia bacterium]|nr:helix-turn-helix transcriptional regulator [Clostridia bacterium]